MPQAKKLCHVLFIFYFMYFSFPWKIVFHQLPLSLNDLTARPGLKDSQLTLWLLISRTVLTKWLSLQRQYFYVNIRRLQVPLKLLFQINYNSVTMDADPFLTIASSCFNIFNVEVKLIFHVVFCLKTRKMLLAPVEAKKYVQLIEFRHTHKGARIIFRWCKYDFFEGKSFLQAHMN